MTNPESSDRWQRLGVLLGEALELAPELRAGYLDRECGDDPDLRAEMIALLAAHEGRGAVDHVADAVSETLPLRMESQAGRRVGPYRLVRVIDYGGMGAVYLAEREDGQFNQRVALKLIRLDVESAHVVRRFLEERQILARLEHPNIARLLDGGIADNGQPYFAMEYVEGEPITQYCANRKLGIGQRLELFLQICAAVQYAHQNLIVHRDLKPKNILVTTTGAAKLLDFGIAKLLADENAASTADTTTMRWLTPEYAAPEQIKGEPITTAADVYALGLLLYELLTGARAYRLDGLSSAEVQRTIIDTHPERPSLRQPALRRQLEGDLDTIVLQALRKEPARRYASALQLAEDIERHRKGLPVKARADTLGYRTAKFITRHRVSVSAAALVSITLLGGIAATSWQARAATEQGRIARDERDRARLEAIRAEQLSSFLVDLFKASDRRDARGDTITARELLDRGVAQLDRRLQDQPELRAGMLDAIARVNHNLGRDDEALRVYQKALELRRAALGRDHPQVAENLTRLGILYRQMHQYDKAEPVLREALDLWTRQLRESEDLALVLSSLADIHMLNDQTSQAEQLYRRAIEVHKRVLGPEHPELARELENLGMLLLHSRPAEGDSLFREALAMRRRILPPDHEDFLRSMDGLGTTTYMRGDYDEAEKFHREALAIRRRLRGERHPDVAFSLRNLSAVAKMKGDLPRAEALLREALPLLREGYGGASLVLPLTNLAKILRDQGKCAEARPLLREALELRQSTMPESGKQIEELRKMLSSCP